MTALLTAEAQFTSDSQTSEIAEKPPHACLASPAQVIAAVEAVLVREAPLESAFPQ